MKDAMVSSGGWKRQFEHAALVLSEFEFWQGFFSVGDVGGGGVVSCCWDPMEVVLPRRVKRRVDPRFHLSFRVCLVLHFQFIPHHFQVGGCRILSAAIAWQLLSPSMNLGL
jgi:hypothetical protein